MRLFIHHVPIHFISVSKWEKQSGTLFDQMPNRYDLLFQGTGHSFVHGISEQDSASWLIRFFKEGQTLPGLSITWVVQNVGQVKKILKRQFEFIEAAGGLVQQENQWLMIHRFDVWDLPKGKIESGEKPKQAAAREVWEECGVPSRPIRKIGKTWHTYTYQNRPVLKLTHWYEMSCSTPHTLIPQLEEDIAAVAWCSEAEVATRVAQSYPSIQWVWDKYQQLTEQNRVNNL